MAHIFSWSKRLLFFLHRITAVTPRYGGSYPAQRFRACNTSHSLSAPSWWVLDIIEHNWNTQKTETTVDKALWFDPFFFLFLKLSRGVCLALILVDFFESYDCFGLRLPFSNHIQGNSTFFPPHPLGWSVSPFILF